MRQVEDPDEIVQSKGTRVFLLSDARLSRILEDTLWHWAGLVVGVIVMIVAVVLIRGWLRDDDDPAIEDQQMLRQIAELQRRGELSGEEYRSIKGRIIGRMDQTETIASYPPSHTEGSRQESGS